MRVVGQAARYERCAGGFAVRTLRTGENALTTGLTQLLLETGLIQFGRFGHTSEPIRFSLDMLPSYPDALQIVVEQAIPVLAQLQVNRLISAADSVPFGVAMGMASSVPLVYSRGSSENPAHDLVGACDIGHPALLLTNVLRDWDAVSRLAANARKVGLEVQTILAIVDLGIATDLRDTQVFALLSLPTVIEELLDGEYLPRAHGQALRNWINAQGQNHLELG